MTDEQLDKVYRDYFQREVPGMLPPLRTAELAAPRTERRSRYVLAASVLALLGLGLLLSSALQPSKPHVKGSASSLFKDAEADGKKLMDTVEMP